MTEQLKIDVVLRNFAGKEIKNLEKGILGFAKTGIAGFKSLGSAIFSVKGLLVGLGAGLALRTITRLVTETADAADKMRDLSLAVGVSTETLSELEQVAEKGGAGMGELSIGFRQLQKALGEFSTTGRGAIRDVIGLMSPAFRQLVQDGAPAEDIFKQVSREMKNLTQAERVFTASKLFGRGGARLLPILSKDLDEAQAALRRFGITISKEASEDSDRFNDSLRDLKMTFLGIERQVVFKVLPGLTKGIDGLVDTLLEHKPAILNFFANVIQALGFMGEVGFKMGAGFTTVIGTFEKLFINTKLLRLEWEGLKVAADLGTNPFGVLRLAQIQVEMETLREVLAKTGDDTEDAADAWRALGRSMGQATEAMATDIKAIASETKNADVASTGWNDTLEKFVRRGNQGLGSLFSSIDMKEFQKELERVEKNIRAIEKAEAAANLELFHKQDALQGLRDGFEDLKRSSQEWGVAMRGAVLDVAGSLSNDVAGGLVDIMNQTVKTKDGFRAMGKSILEDLQKIIVKLIVTKLIESTLSSVGSYFSTSGGNALSTSQMLAVSGKAEGGIVGGHLQPVRGHLAGGAIVRRRGLFELGEGGAPEAVVPLVGGRAIPIEVRRRGGSGGEGGAGGAPTVNLYVTNTFLDAAHEQSFLQRNAKKNAALIAVELRKSAGFRDAVRSA